MPTSEIIDLCARTAHEVNRAYCLGLGDDSQLPWEEAPQWQRDSALNGALHVLEDPDGSDAASHFSWVAEKLRDGWVYGAEKDAKAKTHPCIVSFSDLPFGQQMKDRLFRAAVLGVAASQEDD